MSRVPSASTSMMAVRSFDTRRSTPIEHLFHHLVEVERASTSPPRVSRAPRRRRAAGVPRPAPERDPRPHGAGSRWRASARVVRCCTRSSSSARVRCKLLLGGAALGDVLERAEDPDHLAVEIAQRHLVGLDPTHVARRAAAAARRCRTIGSPVSTTARSQSMNQSASNSASSAHGMSRSGRADQGVGLDAGERREHLVAPEVARLRSFQNTAFANESIRICSICWLASRASSPRS